MSKKIKAVFRSKGLSGKPLTSQPPYGYVKGEGGTFIIDEETAPVVRQIFSLCLAGNGPTKIARVLTEQNIPTPGTVEYRRTGSTRRYYPDYPCKWSTNTVCHILERREYLPWNQVGGRHADQGRDIFAAWSKSAAEKWYGI